MSNKKQPKKETPILLGAPDGKIELDNDAYITKLGGLPVWLDPKTLPPSKVCTCRICGNPMYLIFQSYVPLPESPYHRVLYVWGCNKRACMRKEGSFSVVRSHVVDPAYLKAQKQKEEEKRKKEEKKKAAAAAASQQTFQLGDLWGNSAGSFGNANNTSGGFGMKPATGGGFGASGGFGMKPAAGFGTKPVAEKPTLASILAKKQDTLIDKMEQLNIAAPEPKVDMNSLPQFPGYYLYIDEERTDNYDNMGIDMSRYKEYLDMEKELLMEVDEAGETWQGETYEKQHLPRGVDKQFKKFTERVECSPAQCVRYAFHGQPLFYSMLNQQQQQALAGRCQHCHGPRVFEFQLMPNILSILPTTEYATKEQKIVENSSSGKRDTKAVLDSWNVGMEFGTILVFVCQKDCHPGQLEESTYIEETIVVQYETD